MGKLRYRMLSDLVDQCIDLGSDLCNGVDDGSHADSIAGAFIQVAKYKHKNDDSTDAESESEVAG